MNRETLKKLMAKAKQVSARGADIIKHGIMDTWEDRGEFYEAQVRTFIRAKREDGVHVDVATGEAVSEPITRELGVPAKIQAGQYRKFWRQGNIDSLTARKRVAARLAVERAVAILVEVERSLSERVAGKVTIEVVPHPDRVEDGKAAPAAGGSPGGDHASPAVP